MSLVYIPYYHIIINVGEEHSVIMLIVIYTNADLFAYLNGAARLATFLSFHLQLPVCITYIPFSDPHDVMCCQNSNTGDGYMYLAERHRFRYYGLHVLSHKWSLLS